ncbi:MAG: alpha/beta fold hydrolase [Ilumatobacteraceae bacterium]
MKNDRRPPGETAAPRRFVFLHGFTQTPHHWHDAADRLVRRVGARATSAFVDLPGHGLSAPNSGSSGIDRIGRELVLLAGAGTYIGYSMGGRCALVAAVTGDPRLERLVLIGATPGIENATDRAERRRLDAERAAHLEAVGLDRFLDEWLSLPMFAGLPDDGAALEQRRRNTVQGLADSLRHHGTGSQTPLWDHLGAIRVPTLVLAGALDTKFVEIGERMAERIPDATFLTIERAGHAAHLERPDETVESITDWLERSD